MVEFREAMLRSGETGVIECCEQRGNGSCIRARTVQVVNRCELGVLSRHLIRELVLEYPELRIRLGTFVRKGRKFSHKGQRRKKSSLRSQPHIATEDSSEMPAISGTETRILQHLAASEKRIEQMLKASEERVVTMLSERL